MAGYASIRNALRRALAGEPLNLSEAQLARSDAAVRRALADLARDPGIPAGRLRDAVRHSALRDLLLDWLVSPSASVRAETARLCGELQVEDAVPWLDRLSGEPGPEVRRTAIAALAAMRSAPAAEVLVRRLRSAAADRARLVSALGHGSPDHFLGEVLREPLPGPTEAALLLAVGIHGGPEAVPPLLDRIDSGAAATRAAAARAAGYSGGAGIVPALLVSSLDRSPRVRAEALRSVRRLRARSQGGTRHGPAQAS